MALKLIPADFDTAMPIRKAMALHGVAKMTIIRWRRRRGAAPTDQPAEWSKHELHVLRVNFIAMTYSQLCELLPGRSHLAIKAKANSIGLKKAAGNFGHQRRKFDGQRAKGAADMAAQHLRRDAPVFRCDVNGAANPKGKCWRYGNAVLTEAELIAKAERKGWDGDAWKRVGDTTIGAAALNVLSRMQVSE